MSLKKRLVNTNLFDADDSYFGNQLYYSIYKEKRITVWQELLNRLGVENSFHDYNKKTRDAELNYRIAAS